MSESKFKTIRHIETVRNYLNAVIRELLNRAERHDQTKLESPEVEIFEEYTSKLRDCTYGGDEYKQYMKEMKIAIDHHNSKNSHHPEFYVGGVKNMNLFDLIEMICDWKAATMRHNDGNIYRSLELNKKRFEINDDLHSVLLNTVNEIEKFNVFHKANES